MTAGILGFGRLWPVVPGQPEDEATPVGLAPGQMPVDPRRDGMAQPTAAGRQLSGAIGGVAGGMAQGLLDAAKLPGDVYAGRVDPMSAEGLDRTFNLAGSVMTGSLPVKVPAGALRSGGGAALKEVVDPLADLEALLGGMPAPAAAKQTARQVDPSAARWDLYHGSEAGPDFARFDPSHGRKAGTSEAGALFLTPDADTAAFYAGAGDGAGAAAGPRVYRTTVEPGKTAVFDIGHLAETDPAFNAQARALYTQEAGPNAGGLFDRYLSDLQSTRAQDRQIAEQVRAMGFDPTDPTGASFGYGHVGAAIARAKEQGLDTAVLRGLAEHGGQDQVVALTPGRVRSYYDPSQLLYAGAPVGAGLGAALAASDEATAIRPFGALPR